MKKVFKIFIVLLLVWQALNVFDVIFYYRDEPSLYPSAIVGALFVSLGVLYFVIAHFKKSRYIKKA